MKKRVDVKNKKDRYVQFAEKNMEMLAWNVSYLAPLGGGQEMT